MSSVVAFPGNSAAAAQIPDQPNDDAIAKFTAHCLDRYFTRKTARGFTETYLTRCCRQTLRFLEWADRSIVTATEYDFERWCAHLARELKLRRSTQRAYQNAVRSVFDYIVSRKELQNECQATFGRTVTLVAHGDNCIIHSVEDESAHNRPPMTDDEINTFFANLDARIEHAEIYAPRTVRALERDKALYYAMYIMGIRSCEARALNITDFRPSPDIPELGPYAYVNITNGKGANGSGPRERQVLITHTGFVPVMDWYLERCRPLYADSIKTENKYALFVSEQGNRLSQSTIDARFKEHLEAAGIDTHKYSPHSLRRSMITHEIMRSSTDFARNKAGHTNAATTHIYGQVPLDHHRHQARKLVQNQTSDLGIGTSSK